MKSRKIGVLTLGVSLIAFGVLYLLRVFVPGWDYLTVLRFWPFVLILLGVEVLLSALLPRPEGQPPAKVDPLSVILLFITLFMACGLAAAQFVLGDLDAPTLPSAYVNDTIRTHEKVGWRLSMPAYTFYQRSLFEMIDSMEELGLRYCGGLTFQKVGGGIDKFFDPDQLNEDDIAAINAKLKSKGIRMVSMYYHELPGDEAACRKVFAFAHKFGIETFLSEPKPENLPMIERLCNEFGINVALHNHDKQASPDYWHPEKSLAIASQYGPRIGVCGDLGYWMRDGIDPVEAVRILKNRLLVVQVHDLDEFTPKGSDVLWGTGIGKTRAFFEELASGRSTLTWSIPKTSRTTCPNVASALSFSMTR